jgi:hypothetical protein
MRNITVSVPDDVYTAARVYAAKYRTSVSSVVADFLFSLRSLAHINARISPGAAADLHCDLLRESPGRVHLESCNTRELASRANDLTKVLNGGQ